MNARRLTSGEAAKLRGKLGAMDCALFGRVLRGSLVALSARQYWEKTTDIGPNLHDALLYMLAVVNEQSPRFLP
eukprot:415745-Karenia_brevis.AAC.1